MDDHERWRHHCTKIEWHLLQLRRINDHLGGGSPTLALIDCAKRALGVKLVNEDDLSDPRKWPSAELLSELDDA